MLLKGCDDVAIASIAAENVLDQANGRKFALEFSEFLRTIWSRVATFQFAFPICSAS